MQDKLTLYIDTSGVCKFSYQLYQNANQITAKIFLTFKDEKIIFTRTASDPHFLSKKINFKLNTIRSQKDDDDMCDELCMVA